MYYGLNKKWLLLVFFLFPKYVFSTEGSRFLSSDGYELEISGNFSRLDEVMGHVPNPSEKSHIAKYKNGKKISDWFCNIDAYGFRTSFASHIKGKTKHLLLIDGSFVFGENLSDEATISHHVNVRSKTYEAYPLAFSSYGPNQAWLNFSKNDLPKKILQQKGSAILFTQAADIRRFLGGIEHLSYNYNHPLIKELENGEFKHFGTFENSGTFMQKMISKFCVPFRPCSNLLQQKIYLPTEAEYKTMGHLLKSIEKMYKEQFLVENFSVVWIGSEDTAILHKYSQINIVQLPHVIRSSDYHPNEEGAKAIADFLFSKKLVN